MDSFWGRGGREITLHSHYLNYSYDGYWEGGRGWGVGEQ